VALFSKVGILGHYSTAIAELYRAEPLILAVIDKDVVQLDIYIQFVVCENLEL
jgi:hypothetical protein